MTSAIFSPDGSGVRVDTLQTSRTYFDMAGNGGRNRTAWAAGGDGVLAIDANGDGKINQRSTRMAAPPHSVTRNESAFRQHCSNNTASTVQRYLLVTERKT